MSLFCIYDLFTEAVMKWMPAYRMGNADDVMLKYTNISLLSFSVPLLISLKHI